MQRDGFGQRLVGDQHARGVGADVVDDALQGLSVVHQLPDRGVAHVGVRHFLVGRHGVRDRAGLEGDHPGDAVDVAVAHAQTPAHVAQGGLGPQGSEGDDLGHPVAAVAVDDVAQHLVTPVVLEVHVDVGHFLAFEVQETLEHQVVPHGVDVGDPQAVQHHAGGGAPPHAEEDLLLADEGDDVPHHQEVVGEAGLSHDLQLILHAGAGGVVVDPVPQVEPLPADAFQVGVGILVVGRRVPGQVHLPESQRNVALLGHLAGDVHGLREIVEQRGHLVGGPNVVGRVLHPQAVAVHHVGARLDADVHVLVLVIGLANVVGVVGDQ